MLRARNTRLDTGTAEMLCKALVALAAGALLGVLVAVPYDRLIGLPASACTILRSAVSVALLGALHFRRPPELHLDLDESLAYASGCRFSAKERLGAVLRVLWEQKLFHDRVVARASTAASR
jgi:hypothetical protein